MKLPTHSSAISVVFSTLLLASCDAPDKTSSLVVGSSQMSLTAPALVSRAVNQDVLFAQITVAYDVASEPFSETVPVSRGESGTWDTDLFIPAYTDVSLDILWYDEQDIDKGRVELTSLSRQFTTSDPGTSFTLNFDFSDYDDDQYNIDEDSFTNLQERQNGTSPFDSDAEPGPLDDADVPISPALDDLISVKINDIEGSFFLGAPRPQSNGLILDPLAFQTDALSIIQGGSVEIPITAQSAFSSVYLVGNEISERASGYFKVLLPEPVSEAVLLLNFKADIPIGGTQNVAVQVGALDGSISNVSEANFQTIEVGTGELQVSVSWDKESDVDLFLVEPGGFTISFAKSVSASGGELDLDSNAACNIDGVKNENISYGDTTPPSGLYTVVVSYFSACNQGDTNFVVTVRNDGVVNTYPGVLKAGETNKIVATFQVGRPQAL